MRIEQGVVLIKIGLPACRELAELQSPLRKRFAHIEHSVLHKHELFTQPCAIGTHTQRVIEAVSHRTACGGLTDTAEKQADKRCGINRRSDSRASACAHRSLVYNYRRGEIMYFGRS